MTRAWVAYLTGALTGGGSDFTPTFYVNGVAVPTTVTVAPQGALVDDSMVPLSIGGRETQDRTFDGQLDDLRIYNRVLSAAELQQLY